MFWLMSQFLVFLVLAALVGLFVGWLLWARSAARSAVAFEARAKDLRAEHMALRRACVDADERVAALTAQLAAAGGGAAGPPVEPVESVAAIGPAATDEPDDLERIEGIGPKVAAALRAGGIATFADLSVTDEATLTAAIEAAGVRFAPSLPTWARQATYLVDGDDAGFLDYTELLRGGREVGPN